MKSTDRISARTVSPRRCAAVALAALVIVSASVQAAEGLRLQVLHSSDNESSFMNPNTLEPKILRYATIVNGLQKLAACEGVASIHLTAGDHVISGPFYQAAAQVPGLGASGLADIALFNAMGVVANGMGNHEFDGGINDFARMVSFAALQATELIENTFGEVGTTAFTLNGQRADVRSKETNLGRMAADSTLWYATSKLGVVSDVALKNGGGVRDTIIGPAITRLSVGAALPFNNKIAVLEMTAEQLIAAMENAISLVPALDGRFPQIAGMVWEYDASKPAVTIPSRIKTLVATRADGTQDVLVENFVAQGDLSRTFRMATNDFLSTGGDGYAALSAATKLVTSQTGEQKILSEYIAEALAGIVDLPEPSTPARVVRLDQ